MRNALKNLRRQYFQTVAALVPKQNAQIVILTHLLPDRPEMFEALTHIAPISLIIAIPYSIHPETQLELQHSYKIAAPTLEQLLDANFLVKLILENTNPDLPLIILEIGGYFATALVPLQQQLNNRLMGIVEDTETGHRQYEQLSHLTCPVISVARSYLKETEDALVGTSCIFSTESLLREAGFLMEGKRSLVMGFGKVGKGVAHALLRRHCPVSVFDINPIRRILALSENFHTLEKQDALKYAEIIFGATGNFSLNNQDYPLIKKGAILVSCSSKAVEFDLRFLETHYQKTTVFANFDMYKNDEHFFYLLAEGRPVNFLDGAVIGPVLSLVQAEIMIAIKTLTLFKDNPGIHQVAESDKKLLAEKWLDYFCDQSTGYYRHA